MYSARARSLNRWRRLRSALTGRYSSMPISRSRGLRCQELPRAGLLLASHTTGGVGGRLRLRPDPPWGWRIGCGTLLLVEAKGTRAKAVSSAEDAEGKSALPPELLRVTAVGHSLFPPARRARSITSLLPCSYLRCESLLVGLRGGNSIATRAHVALKALHRFLKGHTGSWGRRRSWVDCQLGHGFCLHFRLSGQHLNMTAVECHARVYRLARRPRRASHAYFHPHARLAVRHIVPGSLSARHRDDNGRHGANETRPG